VLRIIGLFLLVLGGTMLMPLAYAFLNGDDPLPILYGAMVTLASGTALFRGLSRPGSELTVREGVLLVTLVWVCVCLFGGLPFLFSPYFPSFTDAIFEAASGFTTTGATILEDVEILTPSLQLWRCFSHWLGGMGIVLLGIAILPLLGTGGMHMYRAEFSGAKSEKLTPRITETALSLWRIYVALTLAEYAALRLAGMSGFEAACHAFSTLGTGGFSSRTASIAGFGSPLIEYIIIVFMILAGINFTWHYRLWTERQIRGFFADVEFRAYLLILLAAATVICLSLALQTGYSWPAAVRAGLFQVSAIVTTTGFVTDDFEKWRPLCQLLLLALMFVGGCTGSTAGGLKVSRFLLLRRVVYRQFRRIVEPRGIFAIRLGGQVIPEATVQSLLNLLFLALIVFFGAAMILAAMGVDVLTSIAAVTASMFNIGPGLGDVGPADNYAHFPALVKWVLAACMICGRLEFFTALVILTPAFWRK
jgi:trk system potassium uptake protein TrkH